MNLAKRKFKNNLTGEVVEVLDSFEDIAILENMSRVSVKQLVNPSLYTEVASTSIPNSPRLNEDIIDPTTFFSSQNAYNALAEKIKNIPADKLPPDEPINDVISVNADSNFGPVSSNESIITAVSEEDEKAALAAKYGIVNPPVESLQRQNEAFARILGDESENELPQVPQYQQPVQEEPVTRVEASRNDIPGLNDESASQDWNNQQFNQPIQRIEVEDPIIRMFKGVKRNVDFNISLDVVNKIPRLDFIEMMEDSYETSIIDFLADEFTNKLLENPSQIRDMIKDKIHTMVYGEAVKDVNSQITDSVTAFPTAVNDQITDSVTQTKPETKKPRAPRKPRQKKEVVK